MSYSPLELPRGVPPALHRSHDYRATLGDSLLERAGYGALAVVAGSWEGWSSLEQDAR